MRAIVMSLVLGLTLACTAAPRGLHWTIEFETSALHDQTSVVEATILRGSCTGSVLYRTLERGTGAMAMQPPSLGPGTYGFAATAYDATCTVVGSDCLSIDLPGPMVVANVLHPHAGAAACPPATCHLGTCEMDSGMPDAGPTDGGPNDTGIDAPASDGGSCAATETSCTNSVDDDCDGHTDCADADCASNAACALCNGVTCPGCQACDPASGMCRSAPDGEVCASGHCAAGVCCSGCIAAGACEPGNTAAWCGTMGDACNVCGECTTCAGGACVASGNGNACSSGAGRCANGACCTGCIDGTGACNGGGAQGACGSGGNTCSSCSECQTCTGVGCLNMGDGAPCSVGRCLGGACCNGCFIVGTCQPGTGDGACGPVGGSCVACGECRTCGAGRTCDPASDGTSCAGGTGVCSGGACCTGCMQGGACQGGMLQSQCGFGGDNCGACINGLTCNGGVCTGPGDNCGNAIDVTSIGDVYLPIDTCGLNDDFALSGCTSGPSPDIVFSGVQGGTYHFDVPAGWSVGYLDPAGSCTFVGGCGPSYGASGSTGDPRYYFGVERNDGGCGRVTIHIVGS